MKGNPKPEHEWPTEDDWKVEYPLLDPGSSTESEDELEPGT